MAPPKENSFDDLHQGPQPHAHPDIELASSTIDRRSISSSKCTTSSPASSFADLKALLSNPRAFLRSREAYFNVGVTAIAFLFFFVFLLWAPHAPGTEIHHSINRDKSPLGAGLASTLAGKFPINLGDKHDVVDFKFAAQRGPATTQVIWSLEARLTAAPSVPVVLSGPYALHLATQKEVEGASTFDVAGALKSRGILPRDLQSLAIRVASDPPDASIALLTDFRQMGPVGKQRVMIAALILGLTYILMMCDFASRALIAIIGSFVALAAVAAIQGAERLDAVIAAINFSTLGIIFGMMLMVGMLSTTGFIEWVGVQSVVLCKGRPWRLVLVLGAVSWVMGALMDCVTTMCVVVPIALSSLRMVGVEDKSVGSIIIAMAIFGNTGGAATLVGDPPNIVLGASIPGLRFFDFIIYQAPGVLMATIPLVAFFYLSFGRKLHGHASLDLDAIKKQGRVHNPGRLYRILLIVSLALLLMFLVPVHNQDIAWLCVIYAVFLMLITSPKDLGETLSKVDFEVLLYLAGLFCLVQASVQLGLMRAVGNMLGDAIRTAPEGQSRKIAAFALLLCVSAAICTLLDNTAYTVSMVPVIIYLSETLRLPMRPLAFSLSMGACLGANSSIYGAAANSVVISLAKRSNLEIKPLAFSKLGAPATLILVGTALFYVTVVFGVGGYAA